MKYDTTGMENILPCGFVVPGCLEAMLLCSPAVRFFLVTNDIFIFSFYRLG